MLKSLLRDKLFLALVALTISVKLLSLNESWVEQYYTYGIYPYISRTLRFLFGWIPFSIGDLLYIGAVIFLVLKVIKYLGLLARRQVKKYLTWVLLKKLLHLAAMSAIQCSDELKIFYKRKVDSGKNKMSVINAVRNKLISRIFVCVKNKRMYQKIYQHVLV